MLIIINLFSLSVKHHGDIFNYLSAYSTFQELHHFTSFSVQSDKTITAMLKIIPFKNPIVL